MPLQLTEDLDNLYTTTWQKMQDTTRDNFFDATPFWFWLKEKGKLKPTVGGRFLTEPLVYDKNDNVTWITKGKAVSLNDYEFLTIAQYNWRYLVGSIVRFGVDDQQNSGKSQIINFMNAKMENTKESLVTEMETKLFAASGAASDAIDGLQLLCADDPTTSTSVGAINQSTYSWWRNQTKDMTGLSFASNGISQMRTMLNNVTNNRRKDSADIILSGQTPYEYYEDAVLTYYRVQNNKLADAGFHNQTFKGIPMVWSPSCANTRMYFLNTNYLTFKYDPRLFLDMTEWKSIPDQPNDRAAQIVLAGAFTVARRRCQGVMHTIDTA